MMQLFGGFGADAFAAYDEAYPLADGWRDRVAWYQLVPLLVHAILFGGAYGTRAARRARQVLTTTTESRARHTTITATGTRVRRPLRDPPVVRRADHPAAERAADDAADVAADRDAGDGEREHQVDQQHAPRPVENGLTPRLRIPTNAAPIRPNTAPDAPP